MLDIALVKEALDFIGKCIETIGKPGSIQRQKLSASLGDIVELLEAVKLSIDAREIPREQSYGLAVTINFAEDYLNGIFKINHLDDVFNKTLPKIGILMEKADLYIKKDYKKGKTHEYILRHPEVEVETITNPNPIPELETELQRAIGSLRAAQAALAGG